MHGFGTNVRKVRNQSAGGSEADMIPHLPQCLPTKRNKRSQNRSILVYYFATADHSCKIQWEDSRTVTRNIDSI